MRNWWEFWFYVAEGTVEDHPGLPVAEMCSHYYSAYPQFEVAEEDADEGALRCATGMSSGRDLVEEFVTYGVWPLARGWALGEVCPRQMPSRGGMQVRSVAELPELFRLKCPSPTLEARPHLNGNNPSIPRI
jgi:hypothetical protein